MNTSLTIRTLLTSFTLFFGAKSVHGQDNSSHGFLAPSVDARRLPWWTVPDHGPPTATSQCSSVGTPTSSPNNCLELKVGFSTLCWEVLGDYVDFHLTIQQWTGEGWFGWGLSESGAMKGADYVIYLEDSSTGELKIEDRFSKSYELPQVDTHVDVKLLSSNSSNGMLHSIVRRPVRSCDAQDVEFNLLSNNFVWASGNVQNDGKLLMHTENNRGALSGVATKKQTPVQIDSATKVYDFRMPNITIQSSDSHNHYACLEISVPNELLETKGHIVFAEALIDPASAHLVHHIVLNSCAEGEGVGDGYENGVNKECPGMNEKCLLFTAGWAPGAAPLHFSKDANPALGIPVGKGYPTKLVMQMHYYNPKQEVGVNDTSGFRIGFAVADSTAPRVDVGVLATGAFNFKIPPGESAAAVHGVCEGDFIDKDITILGGVNYHMHSHGIRAKTRFFGPEYDKSWGEPLATRRYYDYNFQMMSPFQGASLDEQARLVKAGTTLVTTCEFDTSKETKAVEFGERTQQEMCFGYSFYYPRLPHISFCGTGSLDWASANVALDSKFNFDFHTNWFEQMWRKWNTYNLETMTKELACPASCAWDLDADRWISASTALWPSLTVAMTLIIHGLLF